MNTCALNTKLDAYHDGELAGAELASFERHLAECGECSRQLAQLRAMSDLFAAAPQVKLSQIAMHRLHQRIDVGGADQGLLRLGWTMSAIAASLLLVGSVWLTRMSNPTTTPEAAPPWVGVPVVAQADPAYREIAATPAAQWYLADASTRNDEIP
ncbi:MAG TPA: zf-HC2 domain-containing protein [Tepidisphaeraceae bacterium]|nr:zf-HC2 domain-containing protein [Tepidisphaeraceae bacterium]